MVKAVFDELAKAKPKNHFTVGINDDVTHIEPGVRRDLQHRAGRRGPGHVLRPGLRRHRRRQQELHQDHRRGHRQLRPGLLRLRLQEGRGHDRQPPALRPRAHPLRLPGQQGRLRRLPRVERSWSGTTCSRRPCPGPPSCSTPLPRRRGLGPAAHETCSSASSTRSSRSTPSTPTRWPRRRAWAGASTPSCRPASSTSRTSSRQDEAIAAIKKAIKKTYGKQGEKVVQMNYNAVDQAIANLHEITVPAAASSHVHEAPGRARTRRPSSSRTSPPPSWPARDDRLPVSAPCPPTASGPPTPPSGRSATSPSRSPCGSPTSASSAASAPSTARTPPSAPRSTTRRSWPAPRRPSSPCDAKGKEYAGLKWTVQVAPEDCTGCGACVEICPGKDKTDPEPQGHQHGLPAAAARERSATTSSSS